MAFNFSRGDRGFGDIKFEDDADTGIDFEADTVKIETGGAERFVVENAQATLNVPLHISQSTTEGLVITKDDGHYREIQFKTILTGDTTATDTAFIQVRSDEGLVIGCQSAHDEIIFMTTDGTPTTANAMVITAAKTVGIGNRSWDQSDHAPSTILHLESAQPTITFSDSGTEKGTIGINSSDNILIENKTANKHIVFKVLDQATVKEGLRLDGAVPEVVVNQTSDSLVDFRVESDNNEHMLFVDGSEDKIGIGTASPQSTLHIHADSIDGGAVTISQADNSADASQLNLTKARGTAASPAAVQNNDFIGQIKFEAYDGNSYDNFGDMYLQAAGTISTTSHPTKMILRTTKVSATSPTTAITIDENQNLIAEGNLEAKDTITIRDQNAPASSTSNGFRGEIRYDSNYIYVAVADNTWKRVLLSTW